MSAGHHRKSELTSSELDDLLDEVLDNPKVKAQLARPFRVVTTKDVPLLGSSKIGWNILYLDVHLRYRNWPYGYLPVDGRRLNVQPGLIRHERLEPILENVYGWKYSPPSHEIAQHWEERLYRQQGFDPHDVEVAFRPFIRNDESEPLPKVPVDLDMRPLLEDKKLLERVKAAQDKQKPPQERVGYIDPSRSAQRCELCQMFVAEKYGGPGCTLVKSPISPQAWCRRFSRGALDKPKA